MKKWTAPITIQELTDEEKLEVIDQLLKHSGFFLVSEEDRSLPRARKILLLPEPPFSGVPETPRMSRPLHPTRPMHSDHSCPYCFGDHDPSDCPERG